MAPTKIEVSIENFALGKCDNFIDNDRRIDQEVPLALDVSSDLSKDFTYNTQKNRLMSAGATDFTYDDEGQLIATASATHAFDMAHRLVSITGATNAQYSYDGTANRLEVDRDGVTTRYIYDASGNLLAEADSSDAITRYYIHGAGGLLAMVTASNELYCYHFDATGHTVAMTDSAKAIVNAYAYTPFGTIANQTETIAQPFKFVGKYGVITEPNGLYYMRARYYDPQVGRFISEDPLGFDGGDVNLYAYVLNNPVNRIDPLGQQPPTNIPHSINMQQNVLEAQKMSTIEFYDAVKTGGKWDYKQYGKQYEEFGNYHFGMVGKANGLSENILKRGAGAYQIYSGTSSPQWGWPWGSSPYGDDPRDQHWIGEGVKDYEGWVASPCIK